MTMTWPNFLIIGAAKAGTTSLHRYLQQHPAVYMSPRKEPNFFAFDGEPTTGRGPRFCRMVNNAITDVDHYRALFDAATTETAIGEASTKYLYRERSPERIRHHCPEMKLIAVLRHPAERAFSQFCHNLQRGEETAICFEDAVSLEPERCAADWQDAYHYTAKGYYARQIKRYYARFPTSQLRVYLYEDLEADTAAVLADIATFLQIDPNFGFDTSTRHNVSQGVQVPRWRPSFQLWSRLVQADRGKVRSRRYGTPRLRRWLKSLLRRPAWTPVLTPDFRRQLTARFAEDIAELSVLIQRDLRHWLA
jgi:hypothetical protein